MLLNSTVTGNAAGGVNSRWGGGIFDLNGNTIYISNTVVADNTSGSGQYKIANDLEQNAGSNSSLTINNSVFGSDVSVVTTGVNGNLENVTDLKLGEILDNGGTVLTRSPLDGSVLIGAGSNAALPLDVFDIDHDGDTAEALPLDGRGGIRIVGGTVDIGAVEQIVKEQISGTEADNTIIGGLGNDKLRGLGGNDAISGGDGNDILGGGAGADSLDGGLGRDTIGYRDSATRVIIDLLAKTASGGDAAGDSFIGIENIIGSNRNDKLTGNAVGNWIKGGNGVDALWGGGGNDRLSGGFGQDVLDGNAGRDILFGGRGADTFVLHAETASADRIMDFDSGVDRLRISAAEFLGGLSAGALTSDQFVKNTTGDAGDASDRFIYNELNGELTYDSNGDNPGGTRLIAVFTGIPDLAASDFLIV